MEQLELADTADVPRCPVCWRPLVRVPVTYMPHLTIIEDCLRAACVRARRAALQGAWPRRRRAQD